MGSRFDGQSYIDTRLTFGCRSACRVFSCLSEAARHIAQRRVDAALNTAFGAAAFQHRTHLTVYIDDLCAVFQTAEAAAIAWPIILSTITDLGLVLNTDKTQVPGTSVEFLGVGICAATSSVFLPAGKIANFTALLAKIREAGVGGTVTRYELQQLTGKLTWAACVLVNLRSLCSELIRLASPLRFRRSPVYITERLAEDCELWGEFLASRNFRSMIFSSADKTTELPCYGDAAGREGFGGYAAGAVNEYFCSPWPADWQSDSRGNYHRDSFTGKVGGVTRHETVSSALQEAACIAASILLYARRSGNRRLRVHTDSMSAFLAFRRGRSSSCGIDRVIRLTQIQCARWDIVVLVAWQPRGQVDQQIADGLSRQDPALLQARYPQVDWRRTEIPAHNLARILDCLRRR